MKKLLFVISILMVSFTSQAISLDTLAQKGSAFVDSAKQKAVNTANTIDTSRLSKQVYADFKQALAGIGNALKVGSEHVYRVLVTQQVVKSITWLAVMIIPLIFFFIFKGRLWAWATAQDSEGFASTIVFIMCVAMWIPAIIGFINMPTIVTGLVNPEYGAMLDIMDFIQKIRN